MTLIELDVTDDVSIKKAVQSVHEITGGKLDILVNNSGSRRSPHPSCWYSSEPWNFWN